MTSLDCVHAVRRCAHGMCARGVLAHAFANAIKYEYDQLKKIYLGQIIYNLQGKLFYNYPSKIVQQN